MNSKKYWNSRYQNNDTGWDIGYVSTPIKEYIDQLTNKDLHILIPGSGNAYEAEYLFQSGFKNIFLLDISGKPLEHFAERNPGFPKENLIEQDFFEHLNTYDLIIEQTFFCALPLSKRNDYVNKMGELLAKDGKIIGIFFNTKFSSEGPPFGGDREEYLKLFRTHFQIKTLEPCYNSIPPRAGKELFFIFNKKSIDA